MKILSSILAILLYVSSASAQLSLGDEAPKGMLKTFDGKEISLAEFRGKPVVLEWFNPGCPFVKKHYDPGHMQKLQAEWTAKGVTWISVNSTNAAHQDFLTPEKFQAMMAKYQPKATAYVNDEMGTLGKTFGAKSTPHLFVLNADGKLAYRGAIDTAKSISAKPSEAENYVSAALNELLAGEPVTTPETNSYGCSVKYQ